jgi:hypothetical protein
MLFIVISAAPVFGVPLADFSSVGAVYPISLPLIFVLGLYQSYFTTAEKGVAGIFLASIT